MLRSPRFGRDQLRVQRIGEPRYNFVLHIEEVGEWFIEALGPQMVAGFGVNQLDIHSEAVASPLHRPFEHIADVQLTSELLYVNALPLEGERSVTCNHERATDAR